jgi:lipid A oxidase
MRVVRILALLIFALAIAVGSARGELDISLFTGVALTPDNDLELRHAGGTNLTFHDVGYEGRDFESPPYYGFRGLWFPNEHSNWGFGVEFFHIKLYAETESTVRVTGQRNGKSLDANERIDNTVQGFSISHGLNFPLADVVYRWFPAPRDHGFPNCLQPYAGIGLGAAVPHVESEVFDRFHEEYQFHGPGVQGFVGVNIDISKNLGAIFEYKLTYANLGELDIPDGSIQITPLTNNLVFGVTFRY